jgi:hypothetical protein
MDRSDHILVHVIAGNSETANLPDENRQSHYGDNSLPASYLPVQNRSFNLIARTK